MHAAGHLTYDQLLYCVTLIAHALTFCSSLKPDMLEKLNSLIAVHGPLPVKPLRPPGSIPSGVGIVLYACAYIISHQLLVLALLVVP